MNGHSPSVLRVFTGLAVASVLTLLVAVTWAADDDPGTAPAPADVLPVGVVEGQPVDAYVAAGRAELDALRPAGGATWALVSLAAYQAPDGLTRLFGPYAVAEVYARAPVQIGPTQVVRIPVYRLLDDTLAGMQAAAARRDQEQAGYREFAAALTGGGAGQERLRRAYEAAARTAAAEAAAYRARCACLFALVVRAEPAALARIADRPEVRVVDPAPEIRSLEHTEFRPPLPEQAGIDGAPSSAIAPASGRPLPSSIEGSVMSASPGPSGPAAPAAPSAGAAPPTATSGGPGTAGNDSRQLPAGA